MPPKLRLSSSRRRCFVVGANAPDAGAEVLEFPGHPFYVCSMFQPHVGALAGAPVHPLVTAFLDATAVHA